MILLLENNIRGEFSSVLGDRYVKPYERKTLVSIDASNLYGEAMSESPFYYQTKIEKNPNLEELLNTLEDWDTDYFVEVDLKYPDDIKESAKSFLFCLKNISSPKDKFKEYMDEVNPKIYTQKQKLVYD